MLIIFYKTDVLFKYLSNHFNDKYINENLDLRYVPYNGHEV
jgi:hypothetical protein